MASLLGIIRPSVGQTILSNRHGDLKWTAGVLLSLIVSITMLIFALNEVTSRDFAIETIAKVSDISFGPRGFPGEDHLDELRAALADDDMSSFQPIPSFDIFIAEEDVAGASPRIRSIFFQRLASRIYEQGPNGVPGLVDETVISKELVTQLRLLSVLSAPTHRRLRAPLIGMTAASLLLIIILIRFSVGLGRLTNPGMVLALVGLPWLVGFSLLKKLTQVPVLSETPAHDADISGLVGALSTNVAAPMIETVYPIYATVFATGLVLLFAGGAAWFIRRILR